MKKFKTKIHLNLEYESSIIQNVEYNENLNQLKVKFNSGEEYHYNNIPKNLIIEMMSAKSLGSYLIFNVFNQEKKYPFKKV
jgi:hypothetical protein